MNVPAGMGQQPPFNLGMLVRSVVIDNQVNIECWRDILIHPLEKAQILLMTVSLFAFTENLSRGDVQGGK